MKIAYVVFWDAYRESGVLKKIQAFVKSIREVGNECRLFLVSTNSERRKCVIDISEAEVLCHPLFLRVREHTGPAMLARMASFPLLHRRLKTYKPDVIYFRLGLWMPGIVGTLKRVAPYVIEANTDNDKEAKHWDLLRRILYCATKTFIPRSASGIVSVSSEIGRIYAHYGKPQLVFSNGCHGVFRERLFHGVASAVFVGSPGQAWQGVDKVVELARLLDDIEFHVVGESVSGGPRNLVSHGYLEGAELQKITEECAVGLGTLALHRKGMEEASPLKVREYIQMGLPVVIGYFDTDLSGVPYCLSIPNSEDGVVLNAESIREYILDVVSGSIRVDPVDAERRISYKEKIRDLIGFLAEAAG